MFMAQKKTNADTSFVIKNGFVVLGPNALIRMDTGTQSGGVAYQGKNGFDFTFEKVNISLASNFATDTVICYNSFAQSDPAQFCNLTFNDCTINLSNANRTLTLFNMTDNRCSVTAKINGGEIITSGNTVVFADKNGAAAKSSLSFGKLGGSYTTVTVPKGSVPSEMTVNDGALSFVRTSVASNSVTYQLAPTGLVNFVPKMSIILSNEFVMNVYIPLKSTQKFTFNGIEYNNLGNFDGEIVTLDDGIQYYLVKAYLPSSMAAENIGLKAYVSDGDTSVRATFTFSIPNYASKIIDNPNATATEKILAKDVLVYIKEAYNYFVQHNDADKIKTVSALVDSIIGDYSAEIESGAETKNADGVTDVTLVLDAKPTLRFYVTDESLEFSVGGRKLKTVKGTDNGRMYVELDVFAYMLCETICYGNGGSYHISSFVAAAYGKPYEKLARAFVRYTESASEYRNEWLKNNSIA